MHRASLLRKQHRIAHACTLAGSIKTTLAPHPSHPLYSMRTSPSTSKRVCANHPDSPDVSMLPSVHVRPPPTRPIYRRLFSKSRPSQRKRVDVGLHRRGHQAPRRGRVAARDARPNRSSMITLRVRSNSIFIIRSRVFTATISNRNIRYRTRFECRFDDSRRMG